MKIEENAFQEDKEMKMNATIQAAVMEKDFRLYDYLCVLARIRGLRDDDCVIYRYARAQGSNYQGESLVQWCEGWQDQYHGEPDELVEWIEAFQRWLTKNLDTLAAMERLAANLLAEDDASSVPSKGSDEDPLPGVRSCASEPTTVIIQFSITGVGEIEIQAGSVKDAVEQFAVIDMREPAGRCNFTSFEESGVTIIRIDGDEVQADLWAVEREMGLKA